MVEEAEDGSIGLERVRQDAPYDLVLMDVQMPGLNGLDATAAIRALPDAVRATVPVIALTANAFQADRDAVGLERGQNHREIPGVLVKRLAARLAFLLQGFQLRRYRGQQLNDDRG